MINYKPIVQTIHFKGIEIGVLRLDLIHPEISGNKWFKLKYNLLQAQKEKKRTIITFGGAFSNHIAATSVACKLAGLNSIGIIRGESSSGNNTTLALAKQNGMELLFVNRTEYAQKNDQSYLSRLRYMYQDAYIVPEGGDNLLGQKGCEEILENIDSSYTKIFCASGTGTTYKGIAKSLLDHQNLYVVNVLKFEAKTEVSKVTVINNYHFGGYAKHNIELLQFKNWFETTYQIPLDYVYTAKLFFAVFDLIKEKQFLQAEKILILHSGGLQGNKGYEERYKLL